MISWWLFPAYEVCVAMTKLEAGGSDINIAKKAPERAEHHSAWAEGI